MTKKIVCFAGALALVAGSAFAEKTPAQKDSQVFEDQKEVRKDRRIVKEDRIDVRQDRRNLRDAEIRDDKKGAAAAGSSLKKSEAKLRGSEKQLRKDTHELREDQRQLRNSRLLGLRLERVPALELLHQQRFDLRVARLLGAQRLRRLAVVVGLAHPRVQRPLLGFQRLDLLRQRFELAGFLVGEFRRAFRF